MISVIQLKEEIEKAIKNRVDNSEKFYTEFHKGEEAGFKEVLRRINQYFDELEKCSMCQSPTLIIPKAGSGVESHWVCLKCVNEYNIEVLPEYIENIEEFGHWHRPLQGVIN
jgi:hypothetical protein